MRLRHPAVAGHFYEDDPVQCRQALLEYIPVSPSSGQEDLVGGIVPHAGWVCSGAVAGRVFAELAGRPVETFVLFGSVHTVQIGYAAVDQADAWQTPLGQIELDHELIERACAEDPRLKPDASAHAREHSLEVEVPFIQHTFADARLVPVVVPPVPEAGGVGTSLVKAAQALGRRIAVLGSTDLTHYGPRYGFTPQGIGPEALGWAKNSNDARMIALMESMDHDGVLPEARAHQNACGPGAVQATLLACRQLGAMHGTTLCHTTSSEVLADRYGPMDDSVGYVAVVFN